MLLHQICQIHSGHTARGRLDPVASGGVPALQLRDLATGNQVLDPPSTRYDLGHLADRYFVRSGDVVFRSRGEPNTAAALPASLTEPIAVIVPLLIIRPDPTRVIPEFLVWAINQPDAQRQFDAQAQGTGLRMIPKPVLERLDIPLPNLEMQRRIVEMHALASREVSLLRELTARREQLHTLVLGEAAKAADQHKSKQ